MSDPIKIEQNIGLTFDDVLLLPNYSEIKRQETDVTSFLTKKLKINLPLISSPMDTVTASGMAIALGKLGGIGIIHRNLPIEREVEEVKKVKKENIPAAAAVGIGADFEDRVQALIKAGVDVLLIDSAHGFTKNVIEATKYISQKFTQIELISGNVATQAGAKALIEAGADALRVGMGPGSICTTRIVSGIGVPQITAIIDTVVIAQKYGIPVISDGGCRFSGDIVKALAAGASSVMLGSLFAGSNESSGKLIMLKGKKYKKYRGMGSLSAMKEGSAARYGQDYRVGQEKKLIEEGVEAFLVYKGAVSDIVNQLIGGLRAGMYYVGADNIKELQEKTRFIRITHAGLIESHPHDIFKYLDSSC
ncbi:guanosine monophosphate reductase [Candidatus Gottesmanbacteria bacterium RBG_13_37_7]|uniref:Guanosine monophosphate reductase n=1 Tax=Candidatus Gottesmanbacteria bacterium RBG_13_37_7 TaxID=1798369 RepID=A0A1F5YKJ5_9BACT|nr:MAG: guanosine monophosphate reductase [Candidatus Gottesmanbacteria bacterium RBG_13_37_7]